MSRKNIKISNIFVSRVKIYLMIIFLLLITICVLQPRLMLASFITLIVTIIYAIWSNNKRKDELSKHIDNLTFNIDSITKRTLINSPLPVTIVETDGNVIWKSMQMEEMLNKEHGRLLDNLIKEIEIEIEPNGNKEEKRENFISKEITINDKVYNVIGNYKKNNEKTKVDKYVLMLYFIDKTDEFLLKTKYINEKTCIATIMIDNYEDLMQSMPDASRPQMIATIEKSLYDWVDFSKGVIFKMEKDTFVYILEQKDLKVFEENKFSILDEIKEIDLENKIPVTLSIAVSNEGDSLYEVYKSSLAGLDIVLGRGGDQAIERKDGKYEFFGGRTQELEKRTKVKARIVSNALEELIKESENIIIMGHKNQDIDCIGSALGLYRLAKTMDKNAYIVYNPLELGLESFMNSISEEKAYENVFIDKEKALGRISDETLLIVVDTHKQAYVEEPELLDATEKIVIIDHHRRATDFIEGALLTFHEVYASSASELVTEILQYTEKEVTLSDIEAESLYGGIMVDTKNFSFKTGVRTFEAAAYLRKCGVDIVKVQKWFQSDVETYNIIADIIKESEVVNETVAIAVYSGNNKNSQIIAAKAADEFLKISDITASFVIANLGEKINISGRSIGDINVQIILEKLGGGGHLSVAGAQLEGCTVEQAREQLTKAIDEYFAT